VTRLSINLILVVALSCFSCYFGDDNTIRTYYKSGKLESEFYFDSLCNCKRLIEYYENGNIKQKSQYGKQGLDGTDTIFFMDGKPSIIGEWQNGIKVGQQVAYFSNGVKAYEQLYRNGFKVGTWKYFDSTGFLTKTLVYKDSIVRWDSDRETNTTNYFNRGTLYLTEIYEDNKKVATAVIDSALYSELLPQNTLNGSALFVANCSMCHFKVAESMGPNIKHLVNKHKDEWLMKKILNEAQLSDDAYNISSKKKWHSGQHPRADNLSEDEIKRIIGFLRSQS
jgi:cytochrome c553